LCLLCLLLPAGNSSLRGLLSQLTADVGLLQGSLGTGSGSGDEGEDEGEDLDGGMDGGMDRGAQWINSVQQGDDRAV
jgi:hypothetical protein